MGYLFYRPKIPFVSVIYAHLDQFNYDQAGILNTRLTIVFRAENDNIRANASFSTFHYELSLHGIAVARLVNYPFNVGKHSTLDFHYVVESNYIPLDPNHMAMVQRSLGQNRVGFVLTGHTKTRWRVGPFRSVKFWCNLACELSFRRDDGSNIDTHCISKAG